MPVTDKYRPVDATPSSISPLGPTLGGVLITAVLLAGFTADPLTTWLDYQDEPHVVTASLVHTAASLGETTGLADLYRWMDETTAPLDRTTRWFKKARAGGSVPIDDLPPPPVDVHVDPGDRWAPMAERGRKRSALLVGASSMQYAVGTELERELGAFDIDVFRKGKVSTGLTRDDVFDWPEEVGRLIEEHQPDLVIGQFGGNDAQPIVSPLDGRHDLFSEGWNREYQRRINLFADLCKSANALPVLIGMPVMRPNRYNGRMKQLNALTRETILAAGGRYLSTEEISADAKGNYLASVRFRGRSGRMRMDDGIHFTRLGGQWVAADLITQLQREVLLFPSAEATDDTTPTRPPAPAYRLEVPSGSWRGASPALAWIPRDVPPEGLPVWIVLHGAYGSWVDWSQHAHRELAELASEHGIIIVTPDGEPHGWWLDSPEVPTHRMASWLAGQLLPWIDSTLPSNGRRAISGLSMGGQGALNAVLDHPDLFDAVTSWSGAVDLPHASSRKALIEYLAPYDAAPLAWEARSVLHRVRDAGAELHNTPLLLTVGTRDSTWLGPNEALHEALDARGIAHTWSTHDDGHTWSFWTGTLPEHATFVAEALVPQAAEPVELPPEDAPPPTD